MTGEITEGRYRVRYPDVELDTEIQGTPHGKMVGVMRMRENYALFVEVSDMGIRLPLVTFQKKYPGLVWEMV